MYTTFVWNANEFAADWRAEMWSFRFPTRHLARRRSWTAYLIFALLVGAGLVPALRAQAPSAATNPQVRLIRRIASTVDYAAADNEDIEILGKR